MKILICLCLIPPNLLTYYGLCRVQEIRFVKAFEISLTNTESSLNHHLSSASASYYYYYILALKAMENFVAVVKVFHTQKLISRSNKDLYS